MQAKLAEKMNNALTSKYRPSHTGTLQKMRLKQFSVKKKEDEQLDLRMSIHQLKPCIERKSQTQLLQSLTIDIMNMTSY